MTASALLRNMARTAAILCLMSTVAACSSSGGGRRMVENKDGTKTVRVIPPSTQQELKHLPKGLLPDTTNAVHTR